MGVSVGKEAPDFKGAAYDNGSIRDIALQDYRGRWVVLFFYPADFTCV
jgi:peroxiredoxin (alkyl hydroperoxide reductase subunit C)